MKFKKVCMLMSIVMAMSSVAMVPVYASEVDGAVNVESIAENAPLEAKEWNVNRGVYSWDGVDTLTIKKGPIDGVVSESTVESPTSELDNSSSIIKHIIIEEGVTELRSSFYLLKSIGARSGKVQISFPSTLQIISFPYAENLQFGDVVIPDSVIKMNGCGFVADSITFGTGLDATNVRDVFDEPYANIRQVKLPESGIEGLTHENGILYNADKTALLFANPGTVVSNIPDTVIEMVNLGSMSGDTLSLPLQEGASIKVLPFALANTTIKSIRLNNGVDLAQFHSWKLNVGEVDELYIEDAQYTVETKPGVTTTKDLSGIKGNIGKLTIEKGDVEYPNSYSRGPVLYGSVDSLVLPSATTASVDPTKAVVNEVVLGELSDLKQVSGIKTIILKSPSVVNTSTDFMDKGFENVVLENCTTISKNLFRGQTSIQSITLPEGVTSIGNYAFSGIKSDALKSIVWGNSVTTIGDYAFYDSNANMSALPNSVTTIGEHAFANATNVNISSLPNTVKSIGSHAFANADNVKISKIPSAVTSISDNAFENNKVEYVKVEQGDTPVTIGANAWLGCDKLSDIILPSNISTIGADAFKANMTVNTNLYSDSVATDAYDWVASNRRVTSDSYENAPAPTYNITININIFTNGIGEDVKMSWDGLTWTEIPVDADGNMVIKAPEGATEFYLKSGTTIITVKLTNNGSTVGDIILDEDVSNGGTSSDVDAEGDNTVNVDFSKKSSFKVRIPSQLHADETGKVAYKVGVMGELESMSKVNVVPQDKITDDEGTSFFMENGKGGQINTKVNLDKQSFSATDVLPDTWTYGNGLVSMTDVKPGVWNGSFVLNVNLSE